MQEKTNAARNPVHRTLISYQHYSIRHRHSPMNHRNSPIHSMPIRHRPRSDWRKLLALLLVTGLVSGSLGTGILAWEQPAHREINRKAIDIFRNGPGNSAKYRNAGFALDSDTFAPLVTTSGKFALTHTQKWTWQPVAQHIIDGGYSADEPNVYVSMKHFYDPLKLSGVHELTDQDSVHGLVYEAIPATQWALFREDNPYSLINALGYYKKSMEIPYTAEPAMIAPIGDFRDFVGHPDDLDEMRHMYLGKAMRGLGEVMHLVADMTQPAHVRNDSHPGYEITEQAITGPVAAALLQYSRCDGLIVADFGDYTQDLMISLATWTNKKFYSQDTIADAKLGIKPANWEKPYQSPSLSAMSTQELNGFTTWFAQFGAKSIPMVRKEAGYLYDSYDITTEFAIRQAEVLLPLAAATDARTIDMFLPTMFLTQQVEEVETDTALFARARQAGADTVKTFAVDARLTHQIDQDRQWQIMGMSAIAYSGPGELWRVRDGKTTKISDVEFVNGSLAACQDPETGEMAKGQPQLLMVLGAPDKLTISGPVIDYSVEMDDEIYITVDAGARNFRADSYVFAQNEPKIELSADRTTIMPGEKVNFTVEIEDPPERYELEWDFGDTDPDAAEAVTVRNRKLKMAHIFEKEQDYTVTVRLIDRKRKIVRAEDSIEISAMFGDLSGTWSIVMTVEKENKIFRDFLVLLMKGIVRYIISPIAEALEAGPIDESALDSFTFIGTTLGYETTLTRDKEKDEAGEVVYHGPLTFTGSNTDYIEGSADLYAVTLVIRKGELIFMGEGVNENGQDVTVPFLTHGKLIGDNRLEGTFNLEGTMSGSWIATR